MGHSTVIAPALLKSIGTVDPTVWERLGMGFPSCFHMVMGSASFALADLKGHPRNCYQRAVCAEIVLVRLKLPVRQVPIIQ